MKMQFFFFSTDLSAFSNAKYLYPSRSFYTKNDSVGLFISIIL